MQEKYIHITLPNLPIYVLGDFHGAMDNFLNYIHSKDITNCILIILGDIGVGFQNLSADEFEWKTLDKEMSERNIYVVCLRGNHDDPSLFNREIMDIDKEQSLWYGNVKLVPDYTVVTVNGKNLLLIGGATSIDRLGRINDYFQLLKLFKENYPKLTDEDAKKIIKPSYFPKEHPYYDKNIIEQLYKDEIFITHVLTHTAPSFCFPRTKKGLKQWMETDEDLKKDIDKERKIMDDIYSCLLDNFHPLEEWVYGHFHMHNSEEINFIRFTTLKPLDKEFDAYEITRKDE